MRNFKNVIFKKRSRNFFKPCHGKGNGQNYYYTRGL